MNKKQKMVLKMWNNYKHNCIMQRVNPLYSYKVFRNVHMTEPFMDIYALKNSYRDMRIIKK